MTRRRAVSEVLGAILIAVITVAMGVAYAAYGLTQTQSQTASISDVLRSSARAQGQLLTLTYHCKSGDGRLHVYVYNMGSENSTLKTVVVGSTKYDMPNPDLQMLDMGSTPPQPITDCTVQPKKLVELNIPPQQGGSLDLIVLTAEGGIFVWRLTFNQ